MKSTSQCPTARFVPSLVVGDGNDKPEIQRKEHFRLCVDATPDADVPEAAILDRVVGSLDACPVVIRLLQNGLSQLHVLAVLDDAVFHPVFNIERIIGVSRVARRDWHNPYGQQVAVPIEEIVYVVSKRPD